MPIGAEEAERRLAAVRLPDGREEMVRRAGRLRGPARRAATGLVAHLLPGSQARNQPARGEVGAWLDEAGDRRRRTLFATLHPTLGEALAATWVALVDDPYTVGYSRRAFRAPDHPELTRTSRVNEFRWLLSSVASYDQPPPWFADWAGHLATYGAGLGRLLAVTMDAGDGRVRDVLHATLRGEHDTGQVGHAVLVALLSSSDPGDWEQVERLLIAAQRQEGLRTAILEAVDLAHPGAFARMLGVVHDHGLTRFAATVRAAGVWFSTPFEVRDRAVIDGLISDAVTYLDDPAARDAALRSPDPAQVHLALWTIAFRNAPAAITAAQARIDDASPDVRVAVARMLVDTQLDEAARRLVPRLRDDDLRVAALAHLAVESSRLTIDEVEGPIRDLLDRLAARVEIDVGILRPSPLTLTLSDVADTLVTKAQAADVVRVADLVDRMSANGRSRYARLLADDPATHRERLLDLLVDRSPTVQHVALEALREGPPPSDREAPGLEHLLRRKAAALRRGVIELLLRRDDDAVVASVHRLRSGDALQRTAALELLRELLTGSRGGAAAQELAAAVAADTALPTADRQLVAAAAGHDARDPPTVGTDHLVVEQDRTRPSMPQAGPAALDLSAWVPGMGRVLTSLDAWLAEHRDVEVTVERWGGPEITLVSNLRYLAAPDPTTPWSSQGDNLPLRELVEPWWERTAGQLSDGGLEALLAWPAAEIAMSATTPEWAAGDPNHDPLRQWPSWLSNLARSVGLIDVVSHLAYTPVAAALLRWYTVREARPTWVPALLDVAEAVVAAVPRRAAAKLPSLKILLTQFYGGHGHEDWRDGPATMYLRTAVTLEALRPELFDCEQRTRLWRLARYVDEPAVAQTRRGRAKAHLPDRLQTESLDDPLRYGVTTAEVPARPARRLPPLALTARAVEDQAATRADLLDLIVTPRYQADRTLGAQGYWRGNEQPLGDLTRRRRPAIFDDHPWLEPLVDDVRDMIVATESVRGELPTAVSAAAMQLRSVRGATTVVQLLRTLGRQSLVRGWTLYGGTLTKPEVISHLVRVAFPSPDDTPATFATAARQAELTDKRLLELAVYAPQWAPSVEHTVGWSGLTEAVHWLHAHTKGERWQVDDDVRAEWAATTHERTPLTADELVQGHVDVAWFERLRAVLGDEQFDRLLVAARLASSGDGHKRAELFANALRGSLDRDELDQRIGHKRYQDGVRALGLLPLPDDADDQRDELLERYEQLQRWRKGSSKFGQQRRASEAAAVEVAMANLARTAGYADPERLQWAMEAEAIRDLAAGPVTVTEGDLTVTLSLTDEGAPQLTVRRGERTLKSVPKALAKHADVLALKERVAWLRDQTRRMRASLEAASIRGDAFAPDELAELLGHPTLAPMLRSLVLATDRGVLGRPDRDGTTLLDPAGVARPADRTPLRIAHPVDLLGSDRWHEWQRALFDGRIRQPFKQVFRELYVPTAAERGGVTRSERYAGHQVNPRQAMGLFGTRGWVADQDHGMLRTFHREGITVRVDVLHGWGTAADVTDTMLESVAFTSAGSWQPIPIEDVPPRLFSEAMRDLDLVVSVAHSGGADPEATASTVEMRGALVRETMEVLQLDNVELTGNHALVTGQLGSYSVHLGSATVHRRPGNAVCIIPVGAQHRGRLFLPFVDDDPRTAEVVSKVILLARDERIKDPSILAQLRG